MTSTCITGAEYTAHSCCPVTCLYFSGFASFAMWLGQQSRAFLRFMLLTNQPSTSCGSAAEASWRPVHNYSLVRQAGYRGEVTIAQKVLLLLFLLWFSLSLSLLFLL